MSRGGVVVSALQPDSAYRDSLLVTAHLAGWQAARRVGIANVTQADAIADAAVDAVLRRLAEWESEGATL